jgi:hypothetical protein
VLDLLDTTGISADIAVAGHKSISEEVSIVRRGGLRLLCFADQPAVRPSASVKP